ncbi:MAG TPA: rhombotarget lipoprotein [Planctomycetota bacterium]|nr:rhombotarget lipoprotein [Planctomycetota bacterium]
MLALLGLAACGTIEVRKSTSTLDYLYPQGTPARPAQDVSLQLPVRVALAFAPGDVRTRGGVSGMPSGFGTLTSSRHDPLTEVERTALLERLAADMRTRDFVEGVDLIPSSYLTPGGGFENLDQIAHAFGSDVAVLLSYDQSQFNNTTGWSITYATLVGACIVKGEENQTQTFLDAAVFDIPSRALLFRAAGTATSGSEATPVDASPRSRSRRRARWHTR